MKDPDLHLVAWDRLDEATHTAGLQLMLDLMDRFGGDAMPLLRPLGRTQQNYDGWQSKWPKAPAVLPAGWLQQNGYYLACEMWVNCAHHVSQRVGGELEQWVCGRSAKAAYWHPNESVHEPFGAPGETYYQQQWRNVSGIELPLRSQLIADEQPWFLKLAWYRSTEEIADLLRSRGIESRLDPCQEPDRGALADLALRILSPVDPSCYGFHCRSGAVTFAEAIVSHMSAFALNALTRVANHTIYRLEQYYLAVDVTRPHLYCQGLAGYRARLSP